MLSRSIFSDIQIYFFCLFLTDGKYVNIRPTTTSFYLCNIHAETDQISGLRKSYKY